MHPRPARAAQAGGQGREITRPVKDGPRHYEALFLGPFDDGNLDRLIDGVRDRRRHLFALERGGNAFSLELEAIVVDRPRDIDCQHQRDIGSI